MKINKGMWQHLLVVSGLAAITFPAFAEPQVVLVQVNNEFEFSWEQPVRLRHIMEHSQVYSVERGLIDDIYWPAARFIDESGQQELERRRRTVIDELTQLAAYWEHQNKSDYAALATHLRQQVANWTLRYQPFGALNFEASRQSLDANPLVQSGRYTILLTERPDKLPVFGASREVTVPMLPGQSVRGYVKSLRQESLLLAGYHRDQARLIQPNGQINQYPWAYYNASGDEARAGDILWVEPESSFFPRRYRHLQDELPALLSHWAGDYQFSGTSGTENHSIVLEDREVPAYNHWERQSRMPTRNHAGGVGLMQTPTARMADEGETILMYSDTNEYRRYTVNMQVLPWLEASAFYTRIPNRLYSSRPDFSGNSILTDKGFDVKVRLWEEAYWRPEVSVGLRDFAGTGLFDGEYVVASKRFGSFDFSLGMGFGRLGSRDEITNPFCEVSDRFCTRPGGFSGSGSQLEFGRYFRGPASLFGGVEYQTPWEALRVKVEYDGNDYSLDRAGVPIDGSTPWNVGLSYRVFDWLDTQISYERGDTLMFNIVLRTNMNTLSQTQVEEPRVNPGAPAAETTADVEWTEVAQRLSQQRVLAGSRIRLIEDEQGEQTVRVVAHPWRYRDPDEMLDRAARVIADEVPDTVRFYEFETWSANLPMALNRVEAEAFKRRINYKDPGKSPAETAELFERSAPEFNPEVNNWVHNYEHSTRFGFGLNPFFNQDFGSPETFHFYQLGVKAFGSSWLTENLHVFGELGFNITNNYDKFLFERDPFDLPLPRVRSDFRMHASNDVWVDRLQLSYFRRLSENTYGMLHGGYLERFFSGVGGEILYRRVDSPWAFGANINRVRQRDYEGWFGLEDYETTMGHASVYYQMPWLKDSMIRLDIGRFLAGDDGVGVSFARRFDSGVVVSAYASFTNVSSEDYGEGSFTHGFQISIPFDLIGVNPTRQRVSVSWSPMSRDGGQPLWLRSSLYGITDDKYPFWNR